MLVSAVLIQEETGETSPGVYEKVQHTQLLRGRIKTIKMKPFGKDGINPTEIASMYFDCLVNIKLGDVEKIRALRLEGATYKVVRYELVPPKLRLYLGRLYDSDRVS